jgi:hypothetical protein
MTLPLVDIRKTFQVNQFWEGGRFICRMPTEYSFQSAVIKMIKIFTTVIGSRDSSSSLNFKAAEIGCFHARKYGFSFRSPPFRQA